MATIELNNVRKDPILANSKLHRNSPVVEIFTAMVKGESLDRFGKAKADKAVKYIEELGSRALSNDVNAAAELNAIRRFSVEATVMQELQSLALFGSYTALSFDDVPEREVYNFAGTPSRVQASNGDVVYPTAIRSIYQVPTFTVSGGYEIDYRRIQNGDMGQENAGLRLVQTDILNRARAEIMKRVYEAVKNANGVKYAFEASGLTKEGVDGVLNKVRRYGRPVVLGDYALLSEFTPWAGYVGTVSSNTILGISDEIVNHLAEFGTLAYYNGAVLSEVQNPYNEYALNATGDDFETLAPAGVAFVVPMGARSPIWTCTRGGLTSLTGNDVHTGKVVTRFDLEVGVDVAKGQEHMVGVIHDQKLDSIDAD